MLHVKRQVTIQPFTAHSGTPASYSNTSPCLLDTVTGWNLCSPCLLDTVTEWNLSSLCLLDT